MSTTFPLPLECLQLVIRHLATLEDSNTLATLLRANKYFCSATLPFLYEGPLLLPVLNGKCSKKCYALTRRLHLIATLLIGVPEAFLSELLKVTFPREPVSEENPLPLFAPYYSFVTEVSFAQCHQVFEAIFDCVIRQPEPGFVEYFVMSELEERFIAEDPLARADGEDEWFIVAYGYDRQVAADLTWALYSNAEHIKTLTIPLSDIERYLQQLQRFKILTTITFHLDGRVFDLEESLRSELTTQESAGFDILLENRA
ncbi:hypothetical protein BGZ96_012312 [Linnemannia gamsii]|uniref:F-box domain-containing protein n=1 Tax=Linnemannia gamsii TaxID=64522 RepID=A0ABQ7KD96_9FUNG|nr:hypothetical protein BGZ96_012312 [Linnemannia gamsii]